MILGLTVGQVEPLVLSVLGGRSTRIGGSEVTSLFILGAKIPAQVQVADSTPSSARIHRGQEALASDVTFLHALFLLDPTDPML